jgi:hypothetical protein
LSAALGRQVGVRDVQLDLERATFVLEMVGPTVDTEGLRSVIETWEGYGYKVGDIEIAE